VVTPAHSGGLLRKPRHESTPHPPPREPAGRRRPSARTTPARRARRGGRPRARIPVGRAPRSEGFTRRESPPHRFGRSRRGRAGLRLSIRRKSSSHAGGQDESRASGWKAHRRGSPQPRSDASRPRQANAGPGRDRLVHRACARQPADERRDGLGVELAFASPSAASATGTADQSLAAASTGAASPPAARGSGDSGSNAAAAPAGPEHPHPPTSAAAVNASTSRHLHLTDTGSKVEEARVAERIVSTQRNRRSGGAR
jgi:hypothetical protein